MSLFFNERSSSLKYSTSCENSIGGWLLGSLWAGLLFRTSVGGSIGHVDVGHGCMVLGDDITANGPIIQNHLFLTGDIPRFNSRISPSKSHIKNTIRMHRLYPSHDTCWYCCTPPRLSSCLACGLKENSWAQRGLRISVFSKMSPKPKSKKQKRNRVPSKRFEKSKNYVTKMTQSRMKQNWYHCMTLYDLDIQILVPNLANRETNHSPQSPMLPFLRHQRSS